MQATTVTMRNVRRIFPGRLNLYPLHHGNKKLTIECECLVPFDYGERRDRQVKVQLIRQRLYNQLSILIGT